MVENTRIYSSVNNIPTDLLFLIYFIGGHQVHQINNNNSKSCAAISVLVSRCLPFLSAFALWGSLELCICRWMEACYSEGYSIIITTVLILSIEVVIDIAHLRA